MCTINEPKLSVLATNLERNYKMQTMGKEAFEIEEAAKAKLDVGGGKTACDWMKSGSFYVHGFVYMMVRIAVNVTMTV